MAVLDSFPFQDGGVQFPGVVRRSARDSAGHGLSRNIRNYSPGAVKEDVGTHSSYSSNTVRGNVEVVEQTVISRGYEEQIEHSGAGTSQSFLKCPLCSYQTEIQSLIQWHVQKHSMDAAFQCPACDFRDSDATVFVDHIGTHQRSGKLVRCCFCPKKMPRSKLKSHIRIHRAFELYDCSMCQFSTNYVKTIKCHVDVYHTKRHSCQQCGQSMTKHELHCHMKSVHSTAPVGKLSEKIVTSSNPASRRTDREAPKQPRKVPNQSILSRKLGTSKISKKVTLAHKSQKKLSPKKPYNCGKCEYKTLFKKLLRSHRAKHLLDNSLVCSKCGFKETSCAQFAAHLASHSQNNLIECCFCSYQTQVKKTMSDHVRKHQPISMFDCSECEFSARRSGSLRSHMERRHGKRSRCKSCGSEMSELAMVSHKKECSTHEVPDSGAGPSSVTLENPLNETNMEVAPVVGGDDSQPDENKVSCEFCGKPFAKSYIRKHARNCAENASRNTVDVEATLPDLLHPNSSNAANGDVSGDGVPNIQPAVGNTQPSAFAFDLLDPETFGLGKCRVALKRLNLDAFQFNSRESTTNGKRTLVDQTLNLKEPKRTKTVKPVLRCSTCSFKTKNRHLLKKHVAKHMEDARLRCPYCGLKEMNVSTFAHHIHGHQDDKKRPICCFCDCLSFSSKRGLARHLEKHRPVRFNDCSKCEFSTYRSDRLKNHFERHRKKFNGRGSGGNFNRFRHMVNSSKPVKTSETIQLTSLLDANHSVNHCKSKPVPETSVCAQSITNSSTLIATGSCDISVQSEDGVLKRSAISRPTPVRNDLAENVDSGRLPAEDSVFKIPSNSRKNLSPAAIQQPFPGKSPVKLVKPYLCCSKCSFATRIKSLLKRHVAKHLIDDRLACTKCDFKESNKWAFSRHWFSHNVDRAPLIDCCFCRAQFNKKSCLKGSFPRHLENHQVVDLFDCPKCDFSCKRKDKLEAHYRKLHVNQHNCKACGKFMTLNRFSKHACKRTGLKEASGSGQSLAEPGNSNYIVDKSSTVEDLEIDKNPSSVFTDEQPNVLASEGRPVEAPGKTPSSVDTCSYMLGANLGSNDTKATCTFCKSLVPSISLASHQQLCSSRPTTSASSSAMNMGNMQREASEPHDSTSNIDGVGLPVEASDLNASGSKPPPQPQSTGETKVIYISSDSADSYGSSCADSEVSRVESRVPQLNFSDLIQERIQRMIESPSLNELPNLQNTSSGNLTSSDHASVTSSSQNGRIAANAPQSSSGNLNALGDLQTWCSVNEQRLYPSSMPKFP